LRWTHHTILTRRHFAFAVGTWDRGKTVAGCRTEEHRPGAGIRPDPENGRRWLALVLGTAYTPAADRPKPTITEIVAPLYNPTFLPIPVAT
jgi:hypothetical protein